MNFAKAQLGFWSSMLFLTAFELKGYALSSGFVDIDIALGGYIVGYITTFSGYMLWEVLAGRGNKIFDNRPCWRIISALPFVLLVIIGAMGLYKEIFGDAPWQYNIGFFIASFAVSNGLIPAIKYVDSRLEQS
ncbi:hypothetical protein Q9884_004169 [Vibrio vulnificus]|nr:hypothetical protein [Vibrio vulnificus]ELF6258824.1 hypothetical protein [Vibrio vulnificus]ELH0867354.1 hypothetical protein [Vibrio vulnificus]ELH7844094.1 hypothetical protein [Vibrio vulnificus]MCU8126800.1 hypothetical protein [Vibrio vulnificus]